MKTKSTAYPAYEVFWDNPDKAFKVEDIQRVLDITMRQANNWVGNIYRRQVLVKDGKENGKYLYRLNKNKTPEQIEELLIGIQPAKPKKPSKTDNYIKRSEKRFRKETGLKNSPGTYGEKFIILYSKILEEERAAA